MSRLCSNSLLAERERGCIFAEKFQSAEDVERNQGTNYNTILRNGEGFFNGSTTHIRYPIGNFRPIKNMTVMFWVKFNSLGNYDMIAGDTNGNGLTKGWGIYPLADGRFKFFIHDYGAYYVQAVSGSVVVGKWYFIAGVYDGVNAKLFINNIKTVRPSVSPDIDYTSAGGLTLGNTDRQTSSLFSLDGNLRDFKLFNTDLSDKEIEDYYNNSTFNYENKAIVNLPMGLAEHDITNVRTLDRSGKGSNALLGDGITSTTYPTKSADSGYLFTSANSQYMTTDFALKPITAYSALTLAAWVNFSTTPSLQNLIGVGSSGDRDLIGVGVEGGVGTNTNITFGHFHSAHSWQYADSTIVPIPGIWYHIVGVNDGTDLKIYVQGKLMATDAGEGEAVSAVVYYESFGRRRAATHYNYLNAQMKFAHVILSGLTPLQVLDLYLDEKRRLSQ